MSAHVEMYPERHAIEEVREGEEFPEMSGGLTGKLRFRFRSANGEIVLPGSEAFDDESHLTRGVEDSIKTVCEVAGIEPPDPIEFVLKRVER